MSIEEKLARQELESRRAMILLTYEDLERFFGLPDNMDVVGMHVSLETQAIMLHVRSSELERVHPGTEMPILAGSWNREIRRVAQDETDESSIIGQWIDDGTHSSYQIYVRFEWTPEESHG